MRCRFLKAVVVVVVVAAAVTTSVDWSGDADDSGEFAHGAAALLATTASPGETPSRGGVERHSGEDSPIAQGRSVATSDVQRVPLTGGLTTDQSAIVGQPLVATIDLGPAVAGFDGLLRFDDAAIDFGGAALTESDAQLFYGSSAGVGVHVAVVPDTEPAGRPVLELRLVPEVVGVVEVAFDVSSLIGFDGSTEPTDSTFALKLRVAAVDGLVPEIDYAAPKGDPPTRSKGVSGAADPAATADVTGDGVVDSLDVAEVRMGWDELSRRGTSCDLSLDRMRLLDIDGDGCLGVGDAALAVRSVSAAVVEPPAPQPNPVLLVNTNTDLSDSATTDNVCRTSAGTCSLRAAIQQANATPGPNRIEFAIAGVGPHNITLTDRLPTINDSTGSVVIDGYSQPGASANTDPLASNAVIKIGLTFASYVNGRPVFAISSANNTIRGFAMYNTYYGVLIDGGAASGNRVVGNWLGTDPGATFGLTHSFTDAAGVQLDNGAHHNIVGTPTLGDRNVFAGSRSWGLRIEQYPTDSNVIQNNMFGVHPSGTNKLSSHGGIDVQWAPKHNLIGGSGFREGNLFSGHVYVGLDFSHNTRENYSIGNLFGTDPTGTQGPTWARNGQAIIIKDDARLNVYSSNTIVNSNTDGIYYKHNYNGPNTFEGNWIGVTKNGTALGNRRHGIFLRGIEATITDNVIANNTNDGIWIANDNDTGANALDTTARNRISRNTFYNNGNQGIDITPDGVNINDAGDIDEGAQALLNHPAFQVVTVGSVSGTACVGCLVEMYLNDSVRTTAQGAQFLGSLNADAAGAFTFSDSRITQGARVTAVAIDPANNTSEFTPYVAVGTPMVSWTEMFGSFTTITVGGRTVALTLPDVGASNNRGAHRTSSVVWFDVFAPVDGQYVIDAETYAPTTGSDTFWVLIDGETGSGTQWAVASGAGILTDVVNAPALDPRVLSLTAGPHRIGLAMREDGTGIVTLGLRNLAAATTPTGPPTLTSPGDVSLEMGQPFSLQLVATSGSFFAANGLPDGVTLDPVTGLVTGTPTKLGAFDVSLLAGNSYGTSAARTTWTVVGPPAPPQLEELFGREHRVGDTVSALAIASDPNGDPVTFAATNLPPGLSIDPATGLISGTLTTGGRYVVTVTASDATDFAAMAFVWYVSAGATITSFAPNLGAGASHRETYVYGLNIPTGSTVDLGPDVTVHSVTYPSLVQMTLKVSVSETAAIGARDVLVTTPTGDVSYCVGCFTVTPRPRVTSITPSLWSPGSTQTVEITGEFSWGPTVTVSGTGVTVSNVQRVSGTLLSMTITVASSASTGVRTVTVRNGDQGLERIAALVAVSAPAVPGAPESVWATPGSNSATVTFGVPTSGGPVLSYVVTATNVTVPSAGGQQVTGMSSPLRVDGLTNSHQYRFTVWALNPTGQGPASSASNIVTPAAVPGAPTDVAAVGGDAQATVSFGAPVVGGTATSYVVTVIDLTQPTAGGQQVNTASSPVAVTGLTNDHVYQFTVTASNASGPGVASWPSLPVTLLAVPGAPTDLMVTVGDAVASVSFSPPTGGGASSSYVITVTDLTNGSGSFTVPTESSPIEIAGLTNGHAYSLTVHALNASGAGAPTAAFGPVIPNAPPGVPTNVLATGGDSEATVTFDPSAVGGPAESFVVSGVDLTDPAVAVPAVVASSSPVAVSGLVNGHQYEFSVMAVNAAGQSALSSPSAVVTPQLALPGAPTDVVAVAGDTEVTVSFGAPVGGSVDSYVVRGVDLVDPGLLVPAVVASSSPVVVAGLVNGHQYQFTVAAVNAAGEGPSSAPSAVVVPVGIVVNSVTVSGVSPNLGPGASWREIYVDGTGFTAGTTVSIPDGVTMHQVVVTSATRLTLKVSVAETATAGERSAVVTVSNGDVALCSMCFTVLPPPVISSVSPATWAPGSSQLVEIVGVFSWGPTVTVSGTGVTVSGVVRVSATLLRATVTVSPTAATGVRSLAVRNGDQGVARVPVTIA